MDLNVDGFQYVPIIIPSNDVVEEVEWIIENPSRPTVDCDEVLAALEPEAPETTPTVAPPPPPPPAAPETFYTVILASMQQQNASFDEALARARQLEAEFDVPMYVLNSNSYSSLKPGYWVVYVGTMGRSDAKEVAGWIQGRGYDAYAQKVSE